MNRWKLNTSLTDLKKKTLIYSRGFYMYLDIQLSHIEFSKQLESRHFSSIKLRAEKCKSDICM